VKLRSHSAAPALLRRRWRTSTVLERHVLGSANRIGDEFDVLPVLTLVLTLVLALALVLLAFPFSSGYSRVASVSPARRRQSERRVVGASVSARPFQGASLLPALLSHSRNSRSARFSHLRSLACACVFTIHKKIEAAWKRYKKM
jgi:hypothetical protein